MLEGLVLLVGKWSTEPPNAPEKGLPLHPRHLRRRGCVLGVVGDIIGPETAGLKWTLLESLLPRSEETG